VIKLSKGDSTNTEIKRIRLTYLDRDIKMPHKDWSLNIYHPRNPMGHLFHEHNHDFLVECLNNLKIDLEPLNILDVGCGYGYWLRYMIELGAKAENLTGIDLSEGRINFASQMNPAIHWIHNAVKNLPFPQESFDLVMQVVVFSSILDENLRVCLANEIARVTKVGGYLLWIDHKKSFLNKLAGFSKAKVLTYFPCCSIVYAQSVHPSYFRFRLLYKRYPCLCQVLYHFTKLGCDSWFLTLKKKKGSNDQI